MARCAVVQARSVATPRALLCGLTAAAVLAVAGAAAAQPKTVVEGDLVLALPAALTTGLSEGVGVGVTHGCRFAAGARASWSTSTEYTLAWEVRDDDVRLRVFGALQAEAGRGTFALRLGVGGTLVHETRTRTQGSRAGLTGNALHTSVWDLLPAADLEGVVQLRVLPAWSVIVSGGPSVHLLSGELHAGWTGALGVGWQP